MPDWETARDFVPSRPSWNDVYVLNMQTDGGFQDFGRNYGAQGYVAVGNAGTTALTVSITDPVFRPGMKAEVEMPWSSGQTEITESSATISFHVSGMTTTVQAHTTTPATAPVIQIYRAIPADVEIPTKRATG